MDLGVSKVSVFSSPANPLNSNLPAFYTKKLFFEPVAFSAIIEYTISEPMACRSSRLEYDERVCLASASDGVL